MTTVTAGLGDDSDVTGDGVDVIDPAVDDEWAGWWTPAPGQKWPKTESLYHEGCWYALVGDAADIIVGGLSVKWQHFRQSTPVFPPN